MDKKIYQGRNVLFLHNCAENTPLPQKHLRDSHEEIEQAVKLLKADGSENIHVACKDIEATYREVCSRFREVNAAGGLVCCEDKMLLIFRNGKWDLPKGHQEEGEDISLTAVREVCEETGIEQPRLGRLICITDHCYIYEGEYRLKHTWWYEMSGSDKTGGKPQEEEGITRAEWVCHDRLASCLTNSYPSIVEVFEKDGFFQNVMKQFQK